MIEQNDRLVLFMFCEIGPFDSAFTHFVLHINVVVVPRELVRNLEILLLPINFSAFVFEEDDVISNKAEDSADKATNQNSGLYARLVVEIKTEQHKNKQKQGVLRSTRLCMELLSLEQVVFGYDCCEHLI